MRPGWPMSPRAINAAYLERKLRAIAGVTGSNILPDLSDIGAGLVVLESDRPEWALAGGELRYIRGATIGAGGAGTVTIVALQNPANSGVIAIMERAQYGPGGVTARWWANVTTVVGGSRGYNKDFRQSRGDPLAAVNSACVVGGTNTELPGTSGQDTSSYVLQQSDENWIIPPGQNIAIKTNNNIGVDVAFHWRERPVEGTALQLEIK